MTQPEETTAALIARLHEQLTIKEVQLANVRKSEAVHVDLAHKAYQERDQAKADLEASKAECLQWRKDIDIERAEVARLSRQLDSTKGMLVERSGQCDGWFRACKQVEKERDEFRTSHAALDRLLAERTRERDEARACYGSVCGQLAEQKQSYARLLDLRDRLTRERDEAREQFGRVQADYQVFMLGTAHGAKCWADECGWHCAEGCKAKYARKCVAVAELKTAREQLAKLEWAGRSGWAKEPVCALCWGCRPTDKPSYGQEHYGHRPTCWFAKKEAGANKIRNHRKDCPARSANDVAWVDSQWQVNGCRTAPIEGPRPRPIGCEGCKCTTAKEGAAKPPTVREQWKAKQAAGRSRGGW